MAKKEREEGKVPLVGTDWHQAVQKGKRLLKGGCYGWNSPQLEHEKVRYLRRGMGNHIFYYAVMSEETEGFALEGTWGLDKGVGRESSL